jgi:hypothetical protein
MASHICRLCGSDGPLCFSHVLPEFFYEGTYDEGHRFVSVTDHPRHRPRIMQKGLREHLLCAACEGRLSRYETYVAALLRAIDVDFAHGSRGRRFPELISPSCVCLRCRCFGGVMSLEVTCSPRLISGLMQKQ